MWLKIVRVIVKVAVATGLADKAKDWARRQAEKLLKKANSRIAASEDRLVKKARAEYSRYTQTLKEIDELKQQVE